MDNIIKNLIVTDSIAEESIFHYHSLATQNLYFEKNAYYYLTPWLIMNANIKKNIFEYPIKPTIQLLILFNLLESIKKSTKKNITASDLLLFIKDVFNKIDLKNYEHYYDIQTYHNFINDNEILNKSENDIFLMEIVIVIVIFVEKYEDILSLSSEFIKKITNNNIKILSFISLSVLMFHAKSYYLNEHNNSKEKWLDLLLDQFLDTSNTSINQYINDIDYADKKKFTLMLINYKSQLENKDYDIYTPLPHIRINNLENIFCDKINEKNLYIPGSTSDQLLLISFDFFITADNWYGNLTNNCLSYCQTRYINLFSSTFYYMTNKDIIIFDKFSKIDFNEDDIITTIEIFNLLIH